VLADLSLGHIWKPRLHEIATAMQNQSSAESSFLAHANAHGYRFESGRSSPSTRLRAIELVDIVELVDAAVGVRIP
jgi:NADH dehydrogenase